MRPENYEARRQPPSYEYELNIGPNHPGIEGNYAVKLRLHGDTVIEIQVGSKDRIGITARFIIYRCLKSAVSIIH